jgi:hypothetical protein
MLYMRFSPVSRNTWNVSTPVKSAKPIATIKRSRNRQCSVTISPDHALSRKEMFCLSSFIREHEQTN